MSRKTSWQTRAYDLRQAARRAEDDVATKHLAPKLRGAASVISSQVRQIEALKDQLDCMRRERDELRAGTLTQQDGGRL